MPVFESPEAAHEPINRERRGGPTFAAGAAGQSCPIGSGTPARSARRRALVAFGSVSFAYFAYSGLFGAYAPLWFQSLGYSTLAIGTLASLQSATRIFGPYAWGWFADHSGRRTRMLRIAAAGSLVSAFGFFATPGYGWVATVMVTLFLFTAGVSPLSEAALAHLVIRDGSFDAGRYGRVRVWGSVGFIASVVAGGYLLEALGINLFPALTILLLAMLFLATGRVPAIVEPPHPVEGLAGAMRVLRRPVVAWFFLGMFFTVMAHVSLYAFLSLYLASLGYEKGRDRRAVGDRRRRPREGWFLVPGRWVLPLPLHGWLLLAAVASALRFAATAAYGHIVWVLVVAQCSHSLTFAAQHSACAAVINRHFDGPLRARGQALYSVLGYGVSGVIGGVGGGALSEKWGFGAVFWAASIVAVLAALCSWRALVLERVKVESRL
ncbi:MAG: MFS transporter [Betaproteobacteria bacterium]|nr:MFS transporter [Betaproteobacteria bacterium]